MYRRYADEYLMRFRRRITTLKYRSPRPLPTIPFAGFDRRGAATAAALGRGAAACRMSSRHQLQAWLRPYPTVPKRLVRAILPWLSCSISAVISVTYA